MAPVNKHKHGDLFSGRVREAIIGSKAALGQAQRQRVELSAPNGAFPLRGTARYGLGLYTFGGFPLVILPGNF